MKILNDLVDRSIKLRSKGLNAVVEMEDILAIAKAFKELEQGQCGRALLEREEHHVAVVGELMKLNAELEQLKEQYLRNWSEAQKQCSSLEVKSVELEQRAEAAEAKLEVERDYHDDTLQVMHLWCERAKVAEMKLAELKKQPPVGEAVNIGGAIMVEWERCISDGTQLFTRPAPAINLAELVPDEKPRQYQNGWPLGYSDEDAGWNDCRVAILRKIEEAK